MWCREHTMTEYPYILFNKSPEQLRHLGACGGRAYGRNQRARRALVAAPPEAVPPPAVSRQTAAEAIHLLDTQFSVAARCGKVTPGTRRGARARGVSGSKLAIRAVTRPELLL